jgi:hypothetical protein
MMREFEKWVARVLLLNSGLALAVSLGLLGDGLAENGFSVLFAVAMLGFLSAVLSLRRWRSGLWGGMLYYLLQVGSYFSVVSNWSYSIKAGVSIGIVMHFARGIFVLNVVALALLACTVAVLLWRGRGADPA